MGTATRTINRRSVHGNAQHVACYLFQGGCLVVSPGGVGGWGPPSTRTATHTMNRGSVHSNAHRIVDTVQPYFVGSLLVVPCSSCSCTGFCFPLSSCTIGMLTLFAGFGFPWSSCTIGLFVHFHGQVVYVHIVLFAFGVGSSVCDV